MPEPKSLLVATVKNEGPNILEWVAHHLCIGFTKIQIYQNDSDDETQKHLRTLERVGAIEYFRNHSHKQNWQNKAYRRASETESYRNADWCMTLDGDEFLHIKTGNGRVADLIAAAGSADQLRVNWRMFGHGGHNDLSDVLVTERFTMAEHEDAIATQERGFKSIFRTDAFKRPGIHKSKVPLKDEIRIVDGSGNPVPPEKVETWRSADPDKRKLAQINHYAVRDASSFLLKSVRGSSSHPDRSVELKYWRINNHNDQEDLSLFEQRDRIWNKMKELDKASQGRLFFLRENSLALWRKKRDELLETDYGRELFRQLTGTEAVSI